jgi:transcriptional regulator with XRE-family HTH domain
MAWGALPALKHGRTVSWGSELATHRPSFEASMNDSFGARLRYERERRQIDLKSIAESTKISVSLLEGLERDDVSRWPSGIFRKSFIRSYAEAIGVDPDGAVSEFVLRYPDPQEAIPPVPESPPGTTADARRFRRLINPPSIIVKVPANPAETTFIGGQFLRDIRKRWAAAACDAAVPGGIALCAFSVLGHFWTPFGLSMLCYYAGGIVILGNTPGVCLFAPHAASRSPERG